MAPVPAQRCIDGRDLTEPGLRPDGELLVYAVAEGVTSWLVVHSFDGSSDRVLAAAPPLRPGRGLGGGAWCFTADGREVVYVAADGNLWRQPVVGGPSVQLTDHGPDRSASGPQSSPDGRHLVYVLDQAEVLCLDLRSARAVRLDRGDADFCMDPWIASDSESVSWHAWDVPDMPWDHSRALRATTGGTALTEDRPPFALQQPRVMPDGTPISVRDDHGWLNVWLGAGPLGAGPLVDEPFEHAGPSWGPGQRSYTWSPDGRFVAFARNEAGFGRLCVVDVATREVREVARGVHGQLSWHGNRLAAIRTGARTPTHVVCYDSTTWDRTVVAVGPSPDWLPDELVEPELVQLEVDVEPGVEGVVHARFYRADEPDGRLIVWLHGGPTDQWAVTFLPRIAYWRSRGWSVLVPDHRGSTGHGRAYQQALQGRWGELDVTDTLAITREAHRAGWGTPERTVLMGGSAGGFTALGAVAADPDLYAAAVLLYPVTDLSDLAERSHRLERHYTHSLVGPLPESLPEYQLRSPVWHADLCTGTALLILHGDDDAVVPVAQSRVFAERVNAAGGSAELHVYPGEGHGFRQVAHQLDEYRRIGRFLARHVPVASRS